MLLINYLFIMMAILLSPPTYSENKDLIIVPKKGKYRLFNKATKKEYRLRYNGEPKLLKVETKGELLIVEYDSGDYGTKSITRIQRRLVIKKDGGKLVDRPYREIASDIATQPKWSFFPEKREIHVKLSEDESPKIYKY